MSDILYWILMIFLIWIVVSIGWGLLMMAYGVVVACIVSIGLALGIISTKE